MVSHIGENEEYSDKEEKMRSILIKNCLNSSFLCRGIAFQRSKLQKASFEEKVPT